MCSESADGGFRVPEEDAGRRLDVFLSDRLPEHSRSRIGRAIDAGGARVDGRVAKASLKLKAGQLVEFTPPEPSHEGPVPEAVDLAVLYEDDTLAVIDKPPGMVVHPAKGHWSGTLTSALLHRFGELSTSGGPTRPGIVHRLDRDTSGVIVIAKTDAAHAKLSEQFAARAVEKQYQAIVVGQPDRDQEMIDRAISAHPSQREKMALREGHHTSRAAQTRIAVAERLGPVALVNAFPKTGRTHQIRLHLAHVGCPVLCDKLYGGRARVTVAEALAWVPHSRKPKDDEAERVLLDRQALHACRLAIDHPQTGERMEFTTPLPADMAGVLEFFREAVAG